MNEIRQTLEDQNVEFTPHIHHRNSSNPAIQQSSNPPIQQSTNPPIHQSSNSAIFPSRIRRHSSELPGQCPQYRLIDKDMPRPGLMKMHRTFTDKTCLSSDVASIAFANFLNSAHPSLKYTIQFLLIQSSQNPSQALKKLVLVSQVNPFEFFFDGRKQVQVTSSQIM
jgi:hypothetical protein